MMKRMNHSCGTTGGRVSLYALAIAACLVGTAANAQQDSVNPAPVAEDNGIADIVVTATRRAEPLQNVATSITALTGEQLANKRVEDIASLATSVPSFGITQDSPVSLQLNVRGIVTVKLADPSNEPSVGLFVDEVHIPGIGAAFTDFYDLERVEVIRGPQGVLLGKNVVGGALSVITAKPSFDTGGALTASYGNYDAIRVTGHVTGALSDKLAARFAFQVRSHSGYGQNILTRRDVDNLRSRQFRASLTYGRPEDNFRATLIADYGHDESDGAMRILVDDPARAGTGPGSAFRAANNIGRRQSISPSPEYSVRDSFGISLRADADLSSSVALTSISSYRKSKADWGYNQQSSGSPPASINSYITQVERPELITQELRLGSTSNGRFDWLTGVYYEHLYATRPQMHVASSSLPVPVLSGSYVYRSQASIDTFGAFAQVGFKITDALKITAGGRYSTDKKSGKKGATCLTDGGDGACVASVTGPAGTTWDVTYSKSWSQFLPQAMIELRPTKDVMLYARYAKGYKGGGWQSAPATPADAVVPFNPETVNNYELGIKSDLFDRRLRVNIAAYHMDFKDLQANRTDQACLCLRTTNAGKARIRGVEAEVTIAPVDGMRINLSGAYIDGKYVDYIESATKNYSGNQVQRTPKFKYSVGADYSFDMGEMGRALTASVSYTHQSKLFWDPENISFEAPYGLLDASLRFSPDNAKWSIGIWGKNLTDRYYSSAGSSFFGDLSQVYGAPRTYGIDVGYKF